MTVREKIGLVPAAGLASRIAPLPCSKEIFPVGYFPNEETGRIRPKVACHSLFEKLVRAGVKKAFVVTRPGKWDILSYLGSGKNLGLNLAYLVIEQTAGVPFTIDHAFPFMENALTMFGFPDIIFEPEDAFILLENQQIATGADIVLGLYPAVWPHKADMVKIDDKNRILDIIIKPASTDLRYTWIIAVWTEVFTRFIHEFLSRPMTEKKEKVKEIFIGDLILEGIRAGISVESVVFKNENYVDIGTPEDLMRVIRENVRVADLIADSAEMAR